MAGFDLNISSKTNVILKYVIFAFITVCVQELKWTARRKNLCHKEWRMASVAFCRPVLWSLVVWNVASFVWAVSPRAFIHHCSTAVCEWSIAGHDLVLVSVWVQVHICHRVISFQSEPVQYPLVKNYVADHLNSHYHKWTVLLQRHWCYCLSEHFRFHNAM